jgi:hypothetical protein
VVAPAYDIDNQVRPALGGFDAGADEFGSAVAGPSADVAVSKTDGQTTTVADANVGYTITVSKAGSSAVNGVSVVDNPPATLTDLRWVCSASGAGSSCPAASGTGVINTTVNLGASPTSTVTFVLVGHVAPGATGTMTNTVTAQPPAGFTDPTPGNNTATDTDTVAAGPALPTLAVLDNFNRANANNLGGNWSQITLFTLAAIRVNANTAQAPTLGGQAVWNVPAAGFGTQHAAAVTFPAGSPPLAGSGLTPGPAIVLKANGGGATAPTNLIRVSYRTGQVTVATSTTAGLSYTNVGSPLTVSLAAGDTLAASTNSGGDVFVFKNGAYVGKVTVALSTATSWIAGAGRVGIQLPPGTASRVDNFAGANLP